MNTRTKLRPLIAIAALCGVGAILGGTQSHAAGAGLQDAHATHAPVNSIYADEWALFKNRFITSDGRVVDIERNGVSHSESQSYGLMLAVQAGDQRTFDRILDFTFRNMRERKDRLLSWLYHPNASPRIADRNNASDGDIMVAYALLQAAMKWSDRRYAALAEPLVEDIGRLLLKRQGDLVVLRPAAYGFDRRHHYDGPVLNLSYYIYGALLLFDQVNTRYPFFEAWQNGLQLTEAAMTASRGHAPDWVTLRPERFLYPAAGFKPHSSYDAVRIPLFMMMGGQVPRRFLVPFDTAWNTSGRRVPLEVDLATGRVVMPMNERGYRAIAALTACAVRGEAMPRSLQRFRPGTYFSSALHLLTLGTARRYMPHCVDHRPSAPAQVGQTASSASTATVLAGSARTQQHRSPRRRPTIDDLPGL